MASTLDVTIKDFPRKVITSMRRICFFKSELLKVSESRKEILVSSILPKNELENSNFWPYLLEQKLFIRFLKELKEKTFLTYEIIWIIPPQTKKTDKDLARLIHTSVLPSNWNLDKIFALTGPLGQVHMAKKLFSIFLHAGRWLFSSKIVSKTV